MRQRTGDLSEALEQQTATSEVLRVISSSQGELQPVFDAILANAVRLCQAKFGTLNLFQNGEFPLAATHNVPKVYADYRRQHPVIKAIKSHPLARLAVSNQVVQIDDMRSEPLYAERDPSYIAMVDLAGARTLLAVPMLSDKGLVGAITIFRQEVRPFTDKQIELVQNFAAQAVIAIENTRLLNELRQRTDDLTELLEQQTATSEVLRVISSSPGELQPVFQAMLQNATRICEAKFGILYRSNGQALDFAAQVGTPSEFAEYLRQRGSFHPTPASLLDQVVRTKQVRHTADDTVEAAPGRPARLGGARSRVCVPMLKDDVLVGVISIYRQEVRPFTDKQIDLLKNFASQAVIAIENARLLNELRQRTDELGRSIGELRALGEVSQAVNSTLDLENVLSTIVAKAAQLSGTEAGAIYVFDEGQREFHLRATYGMDQSLIGALTRQHIGLDEPNIAMAVAQGGPIQVADLREEPSTELNEIILRAGFRARLAAPLTRGDDIVGLLVVRRRTPGAFPQNTVDLIKTFAAQSALAIQNARLFENVEARTRELAKSLEDLRMAQDRLVQTQKLASLGQLTAGIAHEIKNPLNFVNNFSGISVELIDELRETVTRVTVDDKTRADIAELADTLRDNLNKIAQHGKRADSIVKNMLLHSREGSGEHRPVNINALVEESLNLAYHGARAEKQGFTIAMERSFDPAVGELDVYPQEITRVLLNLISNGFYAAAKRQAQTSGGDYEPTLQAATRNLGDRIEISIRDNGTGIPADVKEKMFHPFFTTKPTGEGTGLGLSISHDIVVKQHAGTIEVDTQPGEFTEIRIVLPRTAAHFADQNA